MLASDKKLIPKFLAPRIMADYDQRIPKIIWQTMKTNVVPPVISDSSSSWIDKNPEYEYRFFDDSDIYKFIKIEFPQYLRAYKKIKHGAVKADLWRYLIIYKYGGIYADIDCKCVVPLRQWINPTSTWVTHLSLHREVCQWLLMSIPGNLIFKRAAERSYENIIHKPPYVQWEGFKIGSNQKIEMCQGNPLGTTHPILTLAGPPILQQAAEECFINRSAQEIFKFIQVVCVSDKRQCEMNGNVSHDSPKDDYLKALLDMSIPHYDNHAAQKRGVFEYLYAEVMRLYRGIMRRLRRVSSKLIS